MESSITLVVKTPNQRFKDIHIDCDLGWTVKKVKEYLADVHPTNPETISQRLIYSGHLLKDEQQLKEILSKEHESHTLHIVCPSVSETNMKENQAKEASSTTSSQLQGQNPPSNDGLRNRSTGNPYQDPGTSMHGSWSAYNSQYEAYWRNYYEAMQRSFQANTQTSAQQMPGGLAASSFYQWQMNMYAMYHQRASNYQTISPSLQHPSPVTPHLLPSTPTLEQAHQAAALNDQPDGAQPAVNVPGQREAVAANNAQRNANVPLNAGGAMFDDDDENGDGRRDWLDWVHTFLRLSVMLSIMYFYSSTTRILMISLLGFIVYLYQAGWLNWRRPVRDQLENDEQNHLNDNNQDRQQPEEGENRGESESAARADENDSNLPQENIQPPEISPFRAHMNLLYTFVTSFFTSLVPQAAH